MQPSDVLEALLELAGEAGIEVRSAASGGAGDGAGSPASGVCRVQDAIWVVLSGSDPVEVQLAVLGRALCEHAPAVVEGRYLPPAVRERLASSEQPPRPGSV